MDHCDICVGLSVWAATNHEYKFEICRGKTGKLAIRVKKKKRFLRTTNVLFKTFGKQKWDKNGFKTISVSSSITLVNQSKKHFCCLSADGTNYSLSSPAVLIERTVLSEHFVLQTRCFTPSTAKQWSFTLAVRWQSQLVGIIFAGSK